MLAKRMIRWAERHRPSVRVRHDGGVNRLYRYWQTQSGKDKPATNACPYLRRALIYAPLYALRNLLLAGPRIRGHKVPAVLLVILAAAFAAAVVVFGSSAWQIAGLAALCIYAVAGLVLSVYILGWLLDQAGWINKRVPVDWFESNPHGHELAVAPFVLLFLPVIVTVGIVVVVGTALLTGVMGTLIYLFAGDELDLWGRFQTAMSAHPRRLPWLQGNLLYVPLAAWVVWRLDVVRLALWALAGIATLVALFFIWFLLDEHLIKPWLKRREAAAATEKAALAARVEAKQRAWLYQLFVQPEFKSWLLESEHWIVRDFRSSYPAHLDVIAGSMDRPAFDRLCQTISLRSLKRLEFGFVLSKVNLLDASGDEPDELPAAPPAPTPPGWWVQTFRWVRFPVRFVVYAAVGAWEIISAVFGLLWSVKILGLCPEITVVRPVPASTSSSEAN